ncbi:hypothetical protein [Niallia taxi]|uniref:hypothetical protein n=1 Tax=Niallia taxi TaxID=2499688 RepID=UPI003D2697F0
MFEKEIIQLYKYNGERWVKRRVSHNVSLTEQYNIMEKYEQIFKSKPFFLPGGVNPQNYPEILKMESIMKTKLKSYKNDFYIHDLMRYFSTGRKGIWLLRESGTDYIPLKELKADSLEVYDYFLKANKVHYLVDAGELKQINYDTSLKIILEQLKEVA